jgi:hypothetical protein
VLKGIDADAIEGRMQAHYLARYDDGEFIERVLHGSKEDGTDFHSGEPGGLPAGRARLSRPGREAPLLRATCTAPVTPSSAPSSATTASSPGSTPRSKT